MLSHQDNETLVRVGPDTPMGSMFRLFWIPFFFSKDLVADGQPKRVMLLGEDLVAFRDSQQPRRSDGQRLRASRRADDVRT